MAAKLERAEEIRPLQIAPRALLPVRPRADQVPHDHGGGAYGDKAAALRALRENVERLPGPVRARLTLENDDKPREWLGWPLTVEVEAKAKELAVAQLLAEISRV